MKFSPIFPVAVLTCVLFACAGKQNVKAKIFERKEVDENKLMIKYSFLFKGQSFIDSTTIDNKVLNGDSISVSFNSDNPSESTVQLPR